MKNHITDEILRGMALAFFASAYADQADEAGGPLSGEIMDQLPDAIDPEAEKAAGTLGARMIAANWPGRAVLFSQGLRVLYRAADNCDREGADRVLAPELFGHYLAMQAMGTGVGLESFGRAVRDRIKVPYLEFCAYHLSRDYFSHGEGGEQ
jgi:hypothetical protein